VGAGGPPVGAGINEGMRDGAGNLARLNGTQRTQIIHGRRRGRWFRSRRLPSNDGSRLENGTRSSHI
jgi:hypothetical protein